MMVGLQGSGKTTSSGKLGLWLSRRGHRPYLLSIDVYRPAARQQLAVIAEEINVPYFKDNISNDPLDLCRSALLDAQNSGCDVILVDTDEICAAIKDVFEDTRSILEPAGALSIAGLKKHVVKNSK